MTFFFAEVGSQHIGDNGEHGGGDDETVVSLKQRRVRKSITMSLSMPMPLLGQTYFQSLLPLPLLDQKYFQSLLPQTLPYRHHTFILHLVLFHPESDMTLME